EAGVPAGGAHAGANIAQPLVEAAGGNVAAEVRGDPGLAAARALERHPGRAPAGLAGDVVISLGEADALEPPRGPWARVSLVVVAVDDHRSAALELPGRFAVEFLERDLDSTLPGALV